VTTNTAAFIPFSFGPMNCAGKLLAQVELRMVMATLVQKFDMELQSGWDVEEWERNLEDWFVFTKGALPVQVKPRTI
jgi:cytochrome P450